MKSVTIREFTTLELPKYLINAGWFAPNSPSPEINLVFEKQISVLGRPRIWLEAKNAEKRVYIATVDIESFTSNCGIRAITTPTCLFDKLFPLWIKTIESFLYACNYSIVIASDGEPGWLRKLLRDRCSWTELRLGHNRRMEHASYLLYRELNGLNHEWLLEQID